MSVKLLNERHLEFLYLKGGFTGSYESTLVKIPHCWKSHVTAPILAHKSHNTDKVKQPFFHISKTNGTVKPVYNGHSQKHQKLVFKPNYRLMQVKSIAECSKGSILQYFWSSLSYVSSFRSLFCLFLSGRLRQVLLSKNYPTKPEPITTPQKMGATTNKARVLAL